MEIVSFQLGERLCGLPLADVREIVARPELLELPSSPQLLAGLMNLRGHHLPVLHARVLLGLPPAFALSDCVLVVGEELGLIVDHVHGVQTVDLAQQLEHRAQQLALVSAIIPAGEKALLLLERAEIFKQLPTALVTKALTATKR